MRSDWLEAFLTFAASTNFTRAAEALNISQPALHVKIGKLADWLGQPLYRRVGRNLVLTPAGERLAVFAREQTARSDAFVEQFKTGANRQPVELCAGSGAYLYLLGPAVSAFLESADQPLQLVTGNRERTVELVLTGQAHIGVTSLDAMVDGLAAEALTEVEQVLVVPDGHRLASRARVRLKDLDGEALIVAPQGRPHRMMLNRMLMAAGVSWRVAVEAEGWELMLQFARLGVGLAVVNGCCRVPPGLTARPLGELPVIGYHLVHRPGGLDHPGAAALKTLLMRNKDQWRTAPPG
ncbi:MAG: LysR family transcriptional regulator [Hyphomicrobiales bacterium]